MSPYLRRPVRTLEQALKDCGRARERSALIVALPRGRNAEPKRFEADGKEDGSIALPSGRLGASA